MVVVEVVVGTGVVVLPLCNRVLLRTRQHFLLHHQRRHLRRHRHPLAVAMAALRVP